jgi:EcsC protein family
VAINDKSPENRSSSWLLRRAEGALRRGFTQAYETVRVNPERFLLQLRLAHRLPVSNYDDMFRLAPEVLDELAADTIRTGMRLASLEGAGFGIFGLLTVLPDLGVLAAITLRTIQKLSLIYGFPFNTEDETVELWVAAASAAGLDLGKDLLEKEVVQRFVPRVIRAIAVRASGEVVEKWAGRLIPVASSVIGAGLNYYFVRAWGERAQRHFREKHLRVRSQLLLSPASPPQLTAQT